MVVGTKKLTFAALVAAACTSAAPAGFMIENDAVGGGSWSQRIVLFDAGGIDFVYFEILSDTMSGPFGSPAILSFGDPIAGDDALTDWGILAQSSQAVAGAGPDTTLMSVVLEFTGDITQPIVFQGVAFQDGVVQFSATFNWDGLTSSGFHLLYLSNEDVWQPDQTALLANLVPLPAPLWLGSFGLLAVIVLRRRLL